MSEPAQGGADGAASLLRAIDRRIARVAVMGLGYVGLPLVRALVDAGFPVLGFDVDPEKIDKLRRGETYLRHLGEGLARELAESDAFHPTADPRELGEADVVVLCVPTPLGAHREPDLRFVRDSTRTVARELRKALDRSTDRSRARAKLVVLTSTTYPGTTRDELAPILREAGLAPGRDVFLAYSPEREDPGRPGVTTRDLPRLVGGLDAHGTELAVALFSQVVRRVHAVSSSEVAEAAKLLENIYRAVNIALVNELKVLLQSLDIDIWEVVEAAATKPFGFQPFYPGPGLGGHCIPIDPFYLTWKAKEVGLHTRFIELAGEVNTQMPGYVVRRVMEALNDDGKALRGARVLVLGVAYKPDVDDIREAPAAEIIERLQAAGGEVRYHDPHIPIFPSMRRHAIELESEPLTAELLAAQDCALIITDHRAIDWELVARHVRLVVDTRNALARIERPACRVVKA